MGRSGIKPRKPVHHLRKLPTRVSGWLGGDPSPWGPLGRIEATGKIARAFVDPDPRRRRAGTVLFVALALPTLVFFAIGLGSVLTRAF